MKEIRFLKDLPCKLINQYKEVIKLLGGDIYYDKDGNRFAFLTFENTQSSPIYYLQLAIREYSLEGKLIKDSEFFLPYLYAPRGEFVNETPIEIDQETEAVEVYIAKATFDRKNFINDKMVDFTKDDYIENKPSRAPKKKWDNQTSDFVFPSQQNAPRVQTQPSQQNQQQELHQPEFVNGDSSFILPESAFSEEPVNKEPELPELNIDNMPRGSFKARNKALKFIVLGGVVVILAILIFVFYVNINTIVNGFNGKK